MVRVAQCGHDLAFYEAVAGSALGAIRLLVALGTVVRCAFVGAVREEATLC